MSNHVPRGQLALLMLCTAIAAILYVVLNNAFGGPQIRLGGAYEIKASFVDSQGLLKKSFVLARGVEVGSVEGIDVEGGRALITFSVQGRYAPIYRNATVRTGNRTLLGEPYIDLDPGTPAAGRLPSGSTLPAAQVLPTVQFDDALKALNPTAIGHLRSFSETWAQGLSSPQAPAQANAAWSGATTLIDQLHRLTTTLQGQQGEIAGLVDDAGTVFGELGRRETTIQGIVGNARSTLGALDARQASLRTAIAEVPPLLRTGRTTLADARPLLSELTPLIASVRSASPDLTAALNVLPQTARDGATVVDSLPRFNDTAVPVLEQALPVVGEAGPAALRLTPTLRNLIPMLGYVAPRANDITALLANLAEFADHGDNRGIWFRYNVFVDPGASDGTQALEGKTFVVNPYPAPNGQLSPTAFTGRYPRLTPYMPGQR